MAYIEIILSTTISFLIAYIFISIFKKLNHFSSNNNDYGLYVLSNGFLYVGWSSMLAGIVSILGLIMVFTVDFIPPFILGVITAIASLLAFLCFIFSLFTFWQGAKNLGADWPE